MPRIILIIAVAALLLTIAYWFRKLPTDKKKSVLKIVAFISVVAFLGGLALSGRLNWIIALAGAVLPLIPRIINWSMRVLPALQPLMRMWRARKNRNNINAGHGNMETSYLRMLFDQVTGDLHGQVLKGEFKGQSLKDLSIQQLMRFFNHCSEHDPESTAMLMAYLDRYFPNWREQQKADNQQTQSTSEMTLDEACEVLGVSKDASEKEILDAHRNLIQKLHPDRGGSDYLAAKINAAKDMLLKNK